MRRNMPLLSQQQTTGGRKELVVASEPLPISRVYTHIIILHYYSHHVHI